MRCKSCQYSLVNLTERRCPECGLAFDPCNPTTFDSNRTWTTTTDLLVLAITLSFGSLVAVARTILAGEADIFRVLTSAMYGAAGRVLLVSPVLLFVYLLVFRSR